MKDTIKYLIKNRAKMKLSITVIAIKYRVNMIFKKISLKLQYKNQTNKFINARFGLLGIIFLILSALFLYSDVYSQNRQTVFRIGMHTNLIDMDNKTVASSFMQWVEAIKRNSSYKPFASTLLEAEVFTNKEDMFAEHNKRPFDFLNLYTRDYFTNDKRGKLIGCLTSSISETSYKEKLLLVKYNNDNNTDPKQLVNQEIAIANGVFEHWLELFIYEKLGKTKQKLVKINHSLESDNKLLLTIFFKKRGYALIREAPYKDAVELNPQLKNAILVMAESPGFIYNFLAYRNDLDKKFVEAMISEATNLHSRVDGKQVLNLMKLKRVFQITEEDLMDTRKFYERYNQIFKKK